MLSLEQVTALLGPVKRSSALLHTGPGSYIVSFPLPAQTNAVHFEAFVTDPGQWPGIETDSDTNKYVLRSTRDEVARAFAGFGPTASALISLLPERLDKWAVFDMFDAPVPSYARGQLCLAGDAAHASTSNHGAGAGAGFEDVLVLAEVLSELVTRPGADADTVSEALGVYSEVRYERSQWLVRSSRRLAEMFSWKDSAHGIEAEKVGSGLEDRSHQLWDYDIDNIFKKTFTILKSKLARA